MPAPADIGISTSAWSELLLARALERVAELATAVEIRSFGLHTLLSPRNRRAVVRSGLPCSVHGPFGYKGLGDTSDAARREALDEHRRHLEASVEIGAGLYIVHPDWRPERGPRDREVVAALERSFAELADLQADTGVAIVVENMPGAGHSHLTHPAHVARARRGADAGRRGGTADGPGNDTALDLHGLGLLLDVGHASISGCLAAWLADDRAPLRHVHLHDNRGEGDDDDPHLGLGAGVVDVAAAVAVARAAGASMVLEHDREEHVRQSLAHLRRLGLL